MNYPKLKKKKCRVCGCEFKPYKSTDMVCSGKCASIYARDHLTRQKTHIKQVSDKRKIENTKYAKLKKAFMALPENKYCPVAKKVFNQSIETTDIHHTYSGADRQKYFLNVNTWIAVSRKGHRWIHDNPELAYEYGFLVKTI